MVDENFDFHVPSTTRRVDGAEDYGDVREHRGAREGSGETGVKLGASGEMGRQATTSSCGKRGSRDDKDGVGAATTGCEDKEIKWEDNGGEDEQSGVRGDFEKSQKWWLVSPRRGGTGRSQTRWWMVKPRLRGRGSTQGVWSTRWGRRGCEGHRWKRSRAGWWGNPPGGDGECGVQVHSIGAGGECGVQGHRTGAAGRTWVSVASVGCSREHRGERVFRGIGQIPGTGGYSGCWECGGQHRAAQCGARAGQRLRQEIGELVRVRGREWASVVVARMVSEVVVKQGQEQQGQEQQGSAEDAARGTGGRQKSQAQVEEEAQRRWWQEERRRVRRAKRAAGEAARRAKEMELGAQRQEGGVVLPLPRAEAGAAKAKAQVKEAEAAKREAERGTSAVRGGSAGRE